uniref:Transmembrane protein n=1 Tax=Sipha flava TaxID=143950 RepID=A0A2S2QMQ0_9HEMI
MFTIVLKKKKKCIEQLPPRRTFDNGQARPVAPLPPLSNLKRRALGVWRRVRAALPHTLFIYVLRTALQRYTSSSSTYTHTHTHRFIHVSFFIYFLFFIHLHYKHTPERCDSTSALSLTNRFSLLSPLLFLP